MDELLRPPSLPFLLALANALLAWMFRRELAPELPRFVTSRVLEARNSITLGVLALTVVAYLLGAELAWTVASGFTALMFVQRSDTSHPWERID